MTNRVMGVDQNFDLPESVYSALLTKLRTDLHGSEWIDLTLAPNVATTSTNKARYRLTGVGPDLKFELRGTIEATVAGVTTFASMPEMVNETVLGQQRIVYGVQSNNASNVSMRVGRISGLTTVNTPAANVSISLDGISIYL